MRRQDAQRLVEGLDEVRDEIAQVRTEVVRKLERLDAWLVVRDPTTRHAAEAYDGLRKQLGAGAKSRRHHLIDLSRIDDLVATLFERTAEDPSTSAVAVLTAVSDLVYQQMSDAGLELVDATPDTAWAFEDLPPDAAAPGAKFETVRPAYVDVSGDAAVTIRRGRAVLVAPVDDAAAESVEARDGLELELTDREAEAVATEGVADGEGAR